MKRDYKDIVNKLGVPLWYDVNGTPRYDKFHPELCDIYAKHVALLRIACQSCGQRFFVATEVLLHAIKEHDIQFPTKETTDTFVAIGSFAYKDPPQHRCSGDAMLSVPLQIIEFWSFSVKTPWAHTRHPEYEFKLPIWKPE